MSNDIPLFQTDRIRRFRANSPTENDEKTLSLIERFGCEVLSVKASNVSPAWTYTTGVYDTCGGPELITIGLQPGTALSALNAAVDQMRAGVDLSRGRHRDLVGEVECEFRPVHRDWVKHLMHSANWYNEGVDYPVLQAVYPDLENRFPEEADFDTAFDQPLLQTVGELGNLEREFWDAMDPESVLGNWTFPDAPSTRVFLSQAVFEKVEAVTYVSHDFEDGAWQFLGDSMSGNKPPVISCFSHPIEDDPTLNELSDLPLGWWAERQASGESWVRRKHEESLSEED